MATGASFVLHGDWGMTGLNQSMVAFQMAAYAQLNKVDFVVALGDNFYYDGVVNDTDPQWNNTYSQVYNYPSLDVPWYAVLGNHDYHSNPQAQIDFYYHGRDNRWTMPDHTYNLILPLDSSLNTSVEIIFIDTSILCPLETEETAPGGKHEVSHEALAREYSKLEGLLANSSATWLIVAGHYTIYSNAEHGDNTFLISRLAPLLKKYKVNAYFNGHDHVLQHIVWDDVHYITSGHGAEPPLGEFPSDRQSLAKSGSLFQTQNPGFAAVFIDSNVFKIDIIDYRGEVLHTYTILPRDTSRTINTTHFVIPWVTVLPYLFGVLGFFVCIVLSSGLSMYVRANGCYDPFKSSASSAYISVGTNPLSAAETDVDDTRFSSLVNHYDDNASDAGDTSAGAGDRDDIEAPPSL